MDASTLTVRIADYAPVKAALDAARGVCDADGSAPWALSEAIGTLREALQKLPVYDEEC